MSTAGSAPKPVSRFAVPLDALEDDAHVAREDLVEEQGEPPNPTVPADWDQKRANYITWIAAGG